MCIDLWYASALRKIGMPLIHDLQPALQVLGHDNCSTLWLSVEQRWLITINLFRLQPLCRQYSTAVVAVSSTGPAHRCVGKYERV